MPAFFDKKKLTLAQIQRWDKAVEEYNNIQEDNIDKIIMGMSKQDKEDMMAMINPGDTSNITIKEHLIRLSAFFGNSAGDEKSALFARLLNGKPAFPFPPPTSFSYPWYDLMENGQAHDVMVSGPTTLIGKPNEERLAEDKLGILINQCPWSVYSMNEAASELVNLFGERKNPTQLLIVSYQDLVKAYQGNPEFIVNFGESGHFRLYVGQVETNIDRQYAEESILKTKNPSYHIPSSWAFNPRDLFLNAVLGSHPDPDYFSPMKVDSWMLEKSLVMH